MHLSVLILLAGNDATNLSNKSLPEVMLRTEAGPSFVVQVRADWGSPEAAEHFVALHNGGFFGGRPWKL